MSGGKSGGSQTIGFRYSFGIHMLIGRGPVNELVEIRVAEKSAWPYPDQDDSTPPPFDDDAVRLELESWANLGRMMNAVVVYGRFPKRWRAGDYVKIENFKRYDQAGEMLDRSGLYPVQEVMLEGSDQYLVITTTDLDGVPTGAYDEFQWDEFVRAWGKQGDPNYVFTLCDSAGNPIPGPAIDDAPTLDDSPVVVSSTTIQINAPTLFGGDKAEGGIQGPLKVMMGEPTQLAPAELTAMVGSPLPGYRRMFTCFFDGLIASMNPYPKAWKFRVRRTTAGWDGAVFAPEYATIVIDRTDLTDKEVTSSRRVKAANGSHIIYETLTNREWGRGLPRSRINEQSFYDAAATLFSEGFGLCMRWTRSDSIESFVQSVLDHIGATLYTDPETALITLKLLRADYNMSATPLFDKDNGLLSIDAAPVAGAGRYPNEIRVTYHDPVTDKDRTARTHNLGSIQANGGAIVSMSKSYPGLCSPALAARVAQRDMRAYGMELRTFNFKVDRRGSKIRPGQVVRIRDVARGIGETAVRIVNYGDGAMGNGQIDLQGIQDVFGMPALPNVSQEPSGWTPPPSKPCIGRHTVFELPYFVLARMMSAADFAYVKDDSGYIGAALEEGQPINAAFRLGVRNGAPTPDDVPTDSSYYCGYTPPSS